MVLHPQNNLRALCVMLFVSNNDDDDVNNDGNCTHTRALSSLPCTHTLPCDDGVLGP